LSKKSSRDRQSEKYCLASDLKSIVVSAGLSLGKRKGEQNEMEDGPLSKESGSDKCPGFPIKSTRYSLSLDYVRCEVTGILLLRKSI